MPLPAMVIPLALAAFSAQADPQVEILHSNLPGWSQSDVPGHPGLHFRPSGLPFDFLRVAPNGHYALTATTDGIPFQVIIKDGQYMIGIGDATPWAAGETLSLINGIDLSSAGTLGLGCRTVGGSTGNDGYLAVVDAIGWNAEVTESDPVPGLPGVEHGVTFSSLNLMDNGGLAYTVDLKGPGFGFNHMAFANSQVVVQIGADTPQGQLGGGTTPWGGFQPKDGLIYDAGGINWISRGWLWNNGSVGPGIVAVNNEVKVQNGFVVPGSPFSQTVLAIHFVNMDPDGSWWAAGSNGNGREFWVVRDGVVVARTGQPVASGSSLVWSANASGWFTSAGSHGANSYIAGHYDDAGARRTILVMNGTDVVLKEFDQIDINGNGLLDDNVEFRGIVGTGSEGGMDSLGRLTIIAKVRDLTTFDIGYAIVRISPGAPFLDLGTVTAGQDATATIENGIPGQNALMAFSLNGAGPTVLPTPYGDVLVSLTPPWVETPFLIIDALGEASWTQSVPAFLAGAPVWAQAALFDPLSIVVTNPVSTTIQ